MEDVKLTVDGRQYVRRDVTVGDWLESLEFAEKYADENVLKSRAAGEAAVQFVAGYLGVPAGFDSAGCDLAEVMAALRNINANILEAFTGGGAGKNARGRAEEPAG